MSVVAAVSSRVRPDVGRRRLAGSGAVLAVAALVLTVLAVWAAVGPSSGVRRTSSVAPSAAQLAAYENAILPTVQDWGSVVVLGMRPAVGDLRGPSAAALPRSLVIPQAQAWAAALRADREKLRAVPVQPGLDAAARLFDRSLLRYLDAAALFGRAAALSPAAGTRYVDAGVAAATAGDRLYNQASALLQAAHRRLGQPANPNFPNRG